MPEMATVAIPLGRVGVWRPGITPLALARQLRLQSRQDFRCVWSPIRVECHHPQADLAEYVIYILQRNSGELRCLVLRRPIVFRIWHVQHAHLKESRPQGVDIRSDRVWRVCEVLRRRVAMGAAGTEVSGILADRTAEVEQPYTAILPDSHIVRLDVAVQQAAAMDLSDNGAQLCHGGNSELGADGGVALRKSRQLLPINVIHDEISATDMPTVVVDCWNTKNSMQLFRICQVFVQLISKALELGCGMERATLLDLDCHDLAIASIACLEYLTVCAVAYSTRYVVSSVDSGARFDHSNSRPDHESEDQYGSVATA